MSFVEGIKAIPVDLARVRTREGKMRRAAEIGKILVDEIRGVVSVPLSRVGERWSWCSQTSRCRRAA